MTQSGLHVIFGAGPIGLAVMDELLALGFTVRLVSTSGAVDCPDDVEVVAGDGADPAFAIDVTSKADAVYQCAAPRLHRWYDLLPPLQESVAGAARSSGAKLVAVEPMHAYGPPHARHLTETDPVAPTTVKGRVRAELTTSLLDAHRRGDLRVAIGRASDCFGPRALSGRLGAEVVPRLLADRAATVIGDPDLPHTYSYLPDIGMGLVMLALNERADGRVWHLPNPETRTTRAIIAMMADEAGHPARIQRTSRLALRWTGFFDPDVAELLELMYQYEEPFIVASDRFEDTFGIGGTKLREAARRTVGWFRAFATIDA